MNTDSVRGLVMVTTLSWQSVQSCWGIMFVCFVVAHYHYWLYNSVNEGCAKEWVFAGALNYSVDGFILMFAVLICLSCELGVSVCVFSLYFHQKCFFLLLCFHRPRLYFIYIFLNIFFKVFNLQSWKTNLSFYQLCNNSECCSARIGHPHCTL